MINLPLLLRHAAICDLETTGLDPSRGSILSGGFISVANPQRRLALECRAWEGAEVSEAALQINGYTLERVRDRRLISEAELVVRAVDWLVEHETLMLFGKFPYFDRGFLLKAWLRAGRTESSFPVSYRVVDVHSIAVPILLAMGYVMPAKGFTSEQIRATLGLPTEAKPHRAMQGAQAALEALVGLMQSRGAARLAA